MSRKWWLLIIVLVVGLALDVWTKRWALDGLRPGETVHAWGGVLKLTLSFNRGAAFGLSLGPASRVVFIVFSFVVLGWLGLVFRRTLGQALARQLGIALVCAGAVGNLIDRITSARGVTDFLGPYDLGFMLWPIFNVADCYVVIGIALLVLSMRHGSMLEDALGSGEEGAAIASGGDLDERHSNRDHRIPRANPESQHEEMPND